MTLLERRENFFFVWISSDEFCGKANKKRIKTAISFLFYGTIGTKLNKGEE